MKKEKIKALAERYLLAPPKCIFCGDENCAAAFPVCGACFGKYVAAATEGCAVCGEKPLNCRCFAVKNCSALYWLFNYREKEIRVLVYEMKRAKDVYALRFLASRLADAVLTSACGTPPFDCVCFVPRNPTAKLYHNHDHAEELAKELARFLRLPCVPLLRHTGVRGEQKQLAREFRGDAAKTRFDINRSFLTNNRLYYRAPLLVDDVVTTGSTAADCAHILKEYGARLVGLAFIAHTPYRA